MAGRAGGIGDGIDLRSQSPDSMLGLYLHVPFCSAICNYCNFNRGLFDADLKARYVDALLREIAGRLAAHVVQASQMRTAPTRSTSAAARRRSSSPPKSRGSSERACDRSTSRADAEVTLEANPETVNAARLAGLSRRRRQSPQLRRPVVPRRGAAAAVAAALGRPRARRRSAEARAAGFDNVSLDLMMWLPGQQRRRLARVGRRRDRAGARSPVAVPARGVSERAAQGRDGARRAGRRRPTMTRRRCISTAMERLEAAGLRSSTRSRTWRDPAGGRATT